MPAWRRVRDTTTGHQYDIPAENLPLPEGLEEVAGLDVIEGTPRPAVTSVPPRQATTTPRTERGSRARDITTDAPGAPAEAKE